MQQNRVAFFIGRFQPFHLGHLYSLKKCLEIAESVIIGIGSSQESGTENNPWDYETRKEMVECVLESEGLQGETLKVVAVPDDESDAVWRQNVERIVQKLKLAKKEVVVVSNNDWVTDVLGKAGYATYQTGLYNREELEGVKIREMMKRGDKSWEKRVPECVRPYLTLDSQLSSMLMY